MIAFSLNTFVKICLLDTGGRISELQKRLTSAGGYDFYKPLHKAIRTYCPGEPQKVTQILDAPVKDIERKYNADAFKYFASKFGTSKGLEAITSPKTINFQSAGISIRIDPVFELSHSGSRQIYCIWPTHKPQLSQRYGALACHLMRRAYSNTSLGNGSFFFSDFVTGKTYSEKQITNNTNLILMADVTSIGTLIKEL
ncbi:hypothetical protein [Salipiger sp.]|uniref:hypothetical protein n=1 Tax=Salipiger sp. TaxID=2078585 RepID=UPI003A97818B